LLAFSWTTGTIEGFVESNHVVNLRQYRRLGGKWQFVPVASLTGQKIGSESIDVFVDSFFLAAILLMIPSLALTKEEFN
jgi:hypothetical protein